MRARKWDVTSNLFMGFSLGGHAQFSGSHFAGQTPPLAKGTDKKVFSGWQVSVPAVGGGVFRSVFSFGRSVLDTQGCLLSARALNEIYKVAHTGPLAAAAHSLSQDR